MKDLLHAVYGKDISCVAYVHFLGKGFYHVVPGSFDAILRVLDQSPLDLRGAKAFVRRWEQVFDPANALIKGNKISLTLVFPRMRKAFISMVSRIASRFGMSIENPMTMATRLSKTMGMPSAKIVVDRMEMISKKIKLTAPDGKTME